MSRRRWPRDPLLLELVAAIGAGRIEFGSIYSATEYVHSITRRDGSIRINLAISTTDTALHECLHRMRPKWSERAVRARITKLMRELSLKEIDRIHDLVVASAVKRRTPEQI